KVQLRRDRARAESRLRVPRHLRPPRAAGLSKVVREASQPAVAWASRPCFLKYMGETPMLREMRNILLLVLLVPLRASAASTIAVAPNGSAQFKTVQSAVDSVPANKTERVVIHIAP